MSEEYDEDFDEYFDESPETDIDKLCSYIYLRVNFLKQFPGCIEKVNELKKVLDAIEIITKGNEIKEDDKFVKGS